jgi:hypothetical protein
MQDYLRSKNPHLSRWGAFKKIVCNLNCNHNQTRANGVQTCYKANEEKATSLPPGRAYCKKVWCKPYGVCLPDHLPMALSFLSGSALSKAGTSVDGMAPIKSLQMPFPGVYRRGTTTAIRLANYYRTVQPIAA